MQTVMTFTVCVAVTLMAAAETYEVNTAEAFNRRAAVLKPDDELVVRSGVYADWKLELPCKGTARQPIVIRPERPDSVVFRRGTVITVQGDWLVLRGFQFEHCGGHMLYLDHACHNRITDCRFLWCGNPRWTFVSTAVISDLSHSNRIDHCTFEASKSVSVGQLVNRNQQRVGQHNRIDHNIFRDIIRLYGNGQEAIQLGSGGPSDQSAAHAIVEYNVFDNASGDIEVISNKSSGNTIRYNVLAYCKGGLVLRGGKECLVEGNLSVRSTGGIRVHDRGHTIINNLIVAPQRVGIVVSGGTENYAAPQDCLIAHNTIVNAGKEAISIACESEAAKGTRVVNNLLVADGKTAYPWQKSVFVHDTASLGDRVMNNLFWAAGKAQIGDEGKGAILADPLLTGSAGGWVPGAGSPAIDRAVLLPKVACDRLGITRPIGRGPDIGAWEVDSSGASRPQVVLPDIPPRRKPFDAGNLKGEKLFPLPSANPAAVWTRPETGKMAQEDDALKLSDTEIWLKTPLPADFVAEWEYLPTALESRAKVTFAAAGTHGGYTLSWGGIYRGSKGIKCHGIITLTKADDVVAEGHDVVMEYCRKETPKPGAWYRCRLIKHGELLRLEMYDTPVTTWQAKDTVTPIVIWRDRGHVGGPRLGAGTFGIKQSGTGSWRNFRVWGCRTE